MRASLPRVMLPPMTKYITVETERHHDADKVLRIKATCHGKDYFGPFDTALPEADQAQRVALEAVLAQEPGDFELVGYGELKDPTHLAFFFKKI